MDIPSLPHSLSLFFAINIVNATWNGTDLHSLASTPAASATATSSTTTRINKEGLCPFGLSWWRDDVLPQCPVAQNDFLEGALLSAQRVGNAVKRRAHNCPVTRGWGAATCRRGAPQCAVHRHLSATRNSGRCSLVHGGLSRTQTAQSRRRTLVSVHARVPARRPLVVVEPVIHWLLVAKRWHFLRNRSRLKEIRTVAQMKGSSSLWKITKILKTNINWLSKLMTCSSVPIPRCWHHDCDRIHKDITKMETHLDDQNDKV